MKMAEPLVSVAITTYKRAPEVVKRALDSVVRQTYENLEIFLVNDWPDDQQLVSELEKLCETYAGKRRVQYIVVDKNGGACRARNLALRQAKGDFFACLDDDDEWLPRKIELQVRAAQERQAALVYCNVIRKYDDTNKLEQKFETQQPEGNIFDYILGENKIGSCSFPLMKTSILVQCGGFDEGMPALQDWELYLRVLRNNRAAYVQEECAVYHRHSGERISAHPENRIRAYETIHERYRDELNGNRKAAASFYLMGAYFYSMARNVKKAFYYYGKGVGSNPLNVPRNVKDLCRTVGHLAIGSKYV